MYAQHRGPSAIPQNYSGNAFRYPPIGQLPIEEREQENMNAAGADKPASGDMPPRPLPTPALLPTEPMGGGAPPPRHGLISGIGQLVGNEELLLIGLFLLLSGQTDKREAGGSDLLLYLLLLFFCG